MHLDGVRVPIGAHGMLVLDRATAVMSAIGRVGLPEMRLHAFSGVLTFGAFTGLAWWAGFVAVYHRLIHVHWWWALVALGAEVVSYVGYVMRGVLSHRRGAAFGAILAAFDTGIGTGSTVMGWLIERHGFANAFGAAAALSALALPSFLVVDRWYRTGE